MEGRLVTGGGLFNVWARERGEGGINVSMVTYQRSEPALLTVNMPAGNRSQRICVGFL